MRRFCRYVFRSADGLREYLIYLGAVLGAVFLMYMIVLFILLADGIHDEPIMSLFEITGIVFAGFGFASMTDRLLRTCVSFGISRKSFLRGMLRILPVFAAITAAMLQLAAVLTDGIFRLTHNCLDSLALTVCYEESSYAPRVFILNLTITFCLCTTAFGIALLYAGCKNRFHTIVGLIAAGICSYFGIRWIQDSCDVSLESIGFTYRGSFLRFIIQMIIPCMDPMDYSLHIPSDDSFYKGIVLLIAYTLLWGLLFYGVFAILTKRAEVCGKEQGGEI